tara:strand:- start:3719 stop:4003 length:285 start_codon:yes stop_codon:yes gene_type:complete
MTTENVLRLERLLGIDRIIPVQIEHIILPICDNHHWTVVVIYGIIAHYDPLYDKTRHATRIRTGFWALSLFMPSLSTLITKQINPMLHVRYVAP